MRGLFVLWLLVPAVARGEAHVLRIGTIIPDGSGFAREARALGREVEAASGGALAIKWYMGGIAGDEVEMAERVRRGQLDGILSGGMICERLAPSLRVARVPGLLQTWEEASSVVTRLKPLVDKELAEHGYINIAEVVIGPSIVFSRRPIGSLADLQKTPLWVWSTDEVLKTYLPELGARVVPLPIYEAARAYEAGRHDGFATPSAAALGFQWSALTRYYTDLRLGFVVGCLAIAARAFDALPVAAREAVRAGAARSQARYERAARTQEEALLNGLFRKQGLQPVKVTESFRAAFFGAARAARERLGGRLIPLPLMQRVLSLLADHRSEHH